MVSATGGLRIVCQVLCEHEDGRGQRFLHSTLQGIAECHLMTLAAMQAGMGQKSAKKKIRKKELLGTGCAGFDVAIGGQSFLVPWRLARRALRTAGTLRNDFRPFRPTKTSPLQSKDASSFKHFLQAFMACLALNRPGRMLAPSLARDVAA